MQKVNAEMTQSGQRVSIAQQAREAYRAQAPVDRSIELDPALRELVKIRASQINRSAFRIDMHALSARRHGESDRRMHALDAPELAHRLLAVAAINSWNRIAIASAMFFETPAES